MKKKYLKIINGVCLVEWKDKLIKLNNMKNRKRLRVITMSSGDKFRALESEFENVPSSVTPYGAIRLTSEGSIVELQVTQIAVDAYYMPAGKVSNTKNSIKKRAKKIKRK